MGAVLILASHLLAAALFGALAKHWQLAMGGFIVLAVLLLPNGLAGLLKSGKSCQPDEDDDD